MNWIFLGIGGAVVSALSLSSCGGMSGGQTVNEPTVEQMAQYDAQWGLPPVKSHPHSSGGSMDDSAAPEPPPPRQSAPQPQAQAIPEPAPLPPSATAPEPEPPKLDADTIQKLR